MRTRCYTLHATAGSGREGQHEPRGLTNLESPGTSFRAHSHVDSAIRYGQGEGLSPSALSQHPAPSTQEATMTSTGTGTNCSKNPLIDHIGLTVSDYAKAKEFYTKTLEAIGAKLHMEIAPPHTPEGE